jgi:hypothetical protein
MAQAKKKTATKTSKKSTSCQSRKQSSQKKGMCYEKYQKGQQSNTFFLVSMSILAATLLFADLFMMMA